MLSLSLSMIASICVSSPSVGGTPAIRSYMRLASSRAPASAVADVIASPTPSARALTDVAHNRLFFFIMALNLPIPANCKCALNAN